MVISLVFSLLATSAAISHQGHEDVCKCKAWKAVYAGGVACGGGREFFPGTTQTPTMYQTNNSKAQGKMCQNFFQRLVTNECVNLNVGKDEGTWCYVDGGCKALAGGHSVAGGFSWKVCRNSDRQLRHLTPEELYRFSVKHDLLFSGLQRMAYPGVRAGEEGALVNAATWGQNGSHVDVGVSLRSYQSSKTPSWFDTNQNGSLPVMILQGTKVYKVVSSPRPNKKHPGTWTELHCLQGCSARSAGTKGLH
mmetsp:Transcript_5830/g.16586  ORF Transcript_5830/g.16586 Transcript_5830/m.16586 type:complete len:250 (+) Transcript_5830:69-818(+)